ncbi:MAG: hypothetical protein ACPG32_08095, partial [Akkermansiaceae bacterium]
GRFLWKHKRDDTMLAAMRSQVQRSLTKRGEADNESLFERLATGANLPVESVIEAMSRQEIREPASMTRVIQNLQLIHKYLNQ